MEKVYLKDSDVVNELIDVVPVATTEKNGLKPAKDARMEKSMATTVSRVIYEWNSTIAVSTSLLISMTAAGDRTAILFFMSINRSANKLEAPIIILNRIGGAAVPSTPRFKIWLDKSNGYFKIILERTEYTPSIYAKILLSNLPTTDAIPLSVANQDEVDAATYIDVTQ